jgi:hypothetical protein
MAWRRVVALAVGASFAASAYGQASSVVAYQSVIVCLPPSAASGVQAVSISGHSLSCGVDAGGNALSGYVQSWQLAPTSGSGSGFGAIDSEQTAEFWAGAFGSVLFLYFVGAGVGAVLDVIRRG